MPTWQLTVTPLHATIALFQNHNPKRRAENISRSSLTTKNRIEKGVTKSSRSEPQSSFVQMSQCLNITSGIVAHLVHGDILRTTTDGAAACRTAWERLRVACLVNERADTWNGGTTADRRQSSRRQLGGLGRSACCRITHRSGARERRDSLSRIIGQSGIDRRLTVARRAIWQGRTVGMIDLRQRWM